MEVGNVGRRAVGFDNLTIRVLCSFRRGGGRGSGVWRETTVFDGQRDPTADPVRGETFLEVKGQCPEASSARILRGCIQ